MPNTIYENGLVIDRELTLENEMPFAGCLLFVFETSYYPECILHIDQDGGILISCDSIQNITAIDQFYNIETAKSFKNQGLIRAANISPIWLEATHTQKSDFVRLIETTTFKHLISAHGKPLIKYGL